MKADLRKILVIAGVAAVLSVPMAFALNWAVQTLDSHTWTCPAGANFCVLYPLGKGNGMPAYTIKAGSSATSWFESRAIVYPTTSSTSTEMPTTTTTLTTTTSMSETTSTSETTTTSTSV